MTIGHFHYHPDPLPFSNSDLIVFDNLRQHNKKHWVNPFDLYFGIFLPTVSWENEQYRIRQVRILLVSGDPLNFEYQASDMGRSGLQNQIKTLRQSGLTVSLIDLLAKKDGQGVNLRPFIEELKTRYKPTR